MATLHIYFKEGQRTEKAIELGLTLFTEHGRKLLSINFPDLGTIPDIPDDIVERVSIMESEVYNVMRRQGVYTTDAGAKLTVRTRKHTKDGTFFQGMEGYGPTVASVMEIFSLVRQGKIYPTEDWEVSQAPPINPSWKAFTSLLLKVKGTFNSLIKKSKFK